MFIKPDFRLIRRLSFNLICAALLFFTASQAALADELAIWNFNDSDLNVDHGSGTLVSNLNVVNLLFAAGTTNNARLGDTAGQALSLQGGTGVANNGRNISFNVSTVGFSNIVVSFATQGTSTGFNSNQFQYSLDGINFVDFGLNNNPDAAFRIVFNGATSSTGNNRIDNIVVEGTSADTTIPEPTTALLLLSGLGGLYKMKNKRHKRKDD
jgi:hypothetical protein